MQRIRKGDEVIVIAGKDKGKKGVVLSRVDENHVTVEGVNVAKKHVRPNPMTGVEGGIVDKVLPIDHSMGVGEAVNDKKMVDNAVADMTKIAGQKPAVTRTRKAIANFKIREDMPIGCKVTLRGDRMYDFLDRLVTIAFPRVRDFRGVSGRAFDGRGNYNIGLKEQIIFPEIEYDKIDAIRGMNISITTTAKTDEEAKALLAGFHFPFRN